MKSLSGFHYEQIDATDEPQGIKKMDAEEAFITLYGSPVRYRYDGGVPSQLIGHVLREGMTLRLNSCSQMEQFKFVLATDKFAQLSITLERP